MKTIFWALPAALFAGQTAFAQNTSGQEQPDCEAAIENCEIVLIHPYSEDMIVTVGERINFAKRDTLSSPVSTISQTQIKLLGQSYVSGLLRTLPGVSVNQSGSAGSLTQVRLRGGEANHTLVMIDGIEVSNPATGEFDFAALGALDVYKIEVLRGEQSALYGSDAIGGVINIITTAGQSADNMTKWIDGYKANIRAGSFGTVEAAAHANIQIGDKPQKHWFGETILSVGIANQHTNGYDISGLGGEKDGSENTSLRAALNRLTLGDIDVYASGSWSKTRSDFDSDTDFDGRLNDTNDVSISEAATAQLQAAFALGKIENQINLSHASTDIKSPYASFRNDTLGKRTKLNWAAKTAFGQAHSLTAFGELRRESFTQDGGPGAGQNQSEGLDSGALALDYEYQNSFAASGDIVLRASLRQSFHERFENALTWRAGGVVPLGAIIGEGHSLRASYGSGIKNPTMTEIFGFFPASFIGNADIKPERSEGFNIGYQYGNWAGDFAISADYFRSNLKDEIITDFSVFPSTVRNLTTKSKREGFEIEAKWRPSENVRLHGAATFLNAEENGIAELRRPEFTGSARISWTPMDDLALTLSANHTGSQFDTDFATFSRVKLDAFTLVGLNINYAVNDIVSISLRGDNLLDEDYQEVVGYHSQGRGVYGGLSARF